MSPDGHCRAFDAKAKGTVFGSGAGIVVLKRLANALKDGDSIHAIIKGSAINNDGSHESRVYGPQCRRASPSHYGGPGGRWRRSRDNLICRGPRHGDPDW